MMLGTYFTRSMARTEGDTNYQKHGKDYRIIFHIILCLTRYKKNHATVAFPNFWYSSSTTTTEYILRTTMGFLLCWLQPARSYRSIRAWTLPGLQYSLSFLSLSRLIGSRKPWTLAVILNWFHEQEEFQAEPIKGLYYSIPCFISSFRSASVLFLHCCLPGSRYFLFKMAKKDA